MKTKKVFVLSILAIFAAPVVAKAFLPLISIMETNAVTDMAQAHLLSTLRMIEYWGIYYSDRLVDTIRNHGFLYYIVLIMFLWGLIKHILPEQGIHTTPEEHIFRFVRWVVYFGILYYMLTAPYNSTFSLTRMTVQVANNFTDAVLRVLNGNMSEDAEKAFQHKYAYIVATQKINKDVFTKDMHAGLTSFVKTCVPAKAEGMGAYALVDDNLKSYYSKAKSTYLADQDVYNAFDGLAPVATAAAPGVSDVESCENYRHILINQINQRVDENLSNIAKQYKLDKSQLKDYLLKKARVLYDTRISKILAQNGKAPQLSDNELIAAYALSNSAAPDNAYENLIKTTERGYPADSDAGFFAKITDWLFNKTLYSVGAVFTAIASILAKTTLPFLLQGFYIFNTLAFTLAIIFLPLVVIFALHTTKDLKIVIKYIFIVIWIKTWIIPLNIALNLYLNYFSQNLVNGFFALIPLISFVFLAPAFMSIVLTQGNAFINRAAIGMETVSQQGLSIVRMVRVPASSGGKISNIKEPPGKVKLDFAKGGEFMDNKENLRYDDDFKNLE